MVCRECGAYNAEQLTHCRVCAAKLRDDAASEASAPAAAKEDSGDRPARDFVSAPSWPKSAFSGAPENQPIKAPASAPAAAPQASSAPRASILQPPAEPATRRACPHCGKATLADAPYCAYCGELLNGHAKAAPAPVSRPAAAPAKSSARPAPVEDFDDEDYDDDFDDDEDDFKPVKKKALAKRGKKADFDDDFDDEDADDDDFDDEDDDYDDEDYDALPKKRGKGTTILFWGLIVLLIAVIGICGKVIADRNFDGSFSKMFASIGSLFGGEQPAAEDIAEDTGDAAVVEASTMYTATITPYTDPATGSRYYDVNVIAPTGSKVQVVSSAALETSEAVVPDYDNVILRVAEAVFLPNAPCDTETVTVTPNIQVVTADGQSIPITVDPITVTVPVLSLTLESPAETTVQATFTNDPVVITGVVDDPSTEDDHTVEVYINGEKVPVYDGGNFTYNYTPTIAPTTAAVTTPAGSDATAANPSAEATTPPDSTGGGLGETVTADGGDTTVSEAEAASDDTAAIADASADVGSGTGETITIEARKNNCVTARTVITVQPYVIQNMSLLVSNDPATGLSANESDGTLTLQGTVTPGASLAVSCDSDKVSFGEPAVSATGNFTVAVTVSAVGAYKVTFTATQQGYNETTTFSTIERAPTDGYKKFKANAKDLASIMTSITAETNPSGDVYFTGTITEIVGTSPYTIFKVKLSDDSEVVCVNRSAKSKINSSDVKEKKQLFGSLFGFYNDSKIPYVWVWYILNK